MVKRSFGARVVRAGVACVLACLENLHSCDEIGCAFCPTCDCAAPRTTFTDCYAACGG